VILYEEYQSAEQFGLYFLMVRYFGLICSRGLVIKRWFCSSKFTDSKDRLVYQIQENAKRNPHFRASNFPLLDKEYPVSSEKAYSSKNLS